MAERSPFKQEDETPRLYLDSTILIVYLDQPNRKRATR